MSRKDRNKAPGIEETLAEGTEILSEMSQEVEKAEEAKKEEVKYTKENPCPTCGKYTKAKSSGRKPGRRVLLMPVEEMTDAELKREIVNASSVLYKAKQRNAPEDTIAANQERMNLATDERAKRQDINAAELAKKKSEEPKEDVVSEIEAAIDETTVE